MSRHFSLGELSATAMLSFTLLPLALKIFLKSLYLLQLLASQSYFRSLDLLSRSYLFMTLRSALPLT